MSHEVQRRSCIRLTIPDEGLLRVRGVARVAQAALHRLPYLANLVRDSWKGAS